MEKQQPQENQPTKLDKVLKISIIAGILMAVLSLSYYLVIFLPKKEADALEAQKQQAAVQQTQWEKEQVMKQAADQQAAEAQAEKDRRTADQQAAEQKVEQDKQAVNAKAATTTAYNKQQLDNCITALNKVKTYAINHGTYSDAFEHQFEISLDQCYHMYPQN